MSSEHEPAHWGPTELGNRPPEEWERLRPLQPLQPLQPPSLFGLYNSTYSLWTSPFALAGGAYLFASPGAPFANAVVIANVDHASKTVTIAAPERVKPKPRRQGESRRPAFLKPMRLDGR